MTTVKAEKSVASRFGPENFEWSVDAENILTVQVDLSVQTGDTNTGNIRVATTGSARMIDSLGTKMGLNIYRKK